MMRAIKLWATLWAAISAVVSLGTAAWAASGAAQACAAHPFSILIAVKNIKDTRGEITVDLHGADPEKFLKSGAKLDRLRVPAEKGEMHICMPVEGAGVFAVAIYQDRDSNAKLNKTWVGLPAEPYGVSRDAPMRLGPPKHKDAAFEVTGPMTPVTVTLNN